MYLILVAVMFAQQEEDVIGVMPSASISELLPLGDRILIEVHGSPHYAVVGVPAGASKHAARTAFNPVNMPHLCTASSHVLISVVH